MSQRQYALPRAGDVPRLLYVSRAQYSGDWNSSLHTHGCAELFFITGGTAASAPSGRNSP